MSKETMPLISIAMPVYNCETTVAASVRSILLQSYSEWELLVIDDGSTDATLEIVRGFQDPRIRVVVDGEHRFLPYRLNQAIALARGEFFARMDGDDIAYPARLEQQLNYMLAHPDLDLIGTWVLVFGSNGVPIGKRARPIGQKWCYKTLLQSLPIAHPTFMGTMAWFRQHTYPVQPAHAQDQQLLLSALDTSNFGVLPAIMLGYREESLSIKKQFRYRKSYSELFVVRSGGRSTLTAVAAIAVQLSKMCVDWMALASGLNYHILRSRASPLSEQERQDWRNVWMQVMS